MTRRSLSRAQRVRIFDAAGGICALCGNKIHAERGELWELDHSIPLACGGTDDEANLFPVHKACHGDKTKTDVKDAAKVKRQRAKHLGVKKQQSRPMAGTKASGVKILFGGGWEWRT